MTRLLACLLMPAALLAAESWSLEKLYTRPFVWGTSPTEITWSKQGHTLLFLWNAEGNRFRDLYAYHPAAILPSVPGDRMAEHAAPAGCCKGPAVSGTRGEDWEWKTSRNDCNGSSRSLGSPSGAARRSPSPCVDGYQNARHSGCRRVCMCDGLWPIRALIFWS